ncbi:helix-turn-helix domain-containing protein [Rhodococcus sp. (in: high G+C Gram-positive bacteria)]|uniref:PucR family transcriptional regulator n=1 Tax=unclassified Rhodococcus (in: high G+C Gram-positive bacteria) TaxID=192944 RepID=UPI002AD8034D|nr:helix-turn-helix domain-containing protein [Rhodococcus sp. (in: high G+C Gram-positive bacteria)]
MTSPGSQERRAVARGRLARVPATAADDVLIASAGIARSLAARESDIVRSMTSLLAHDIDQLDEDPVLVELLEASVHGNVSTIIHVLANDIPVDHLQPTTAAVEYALRLAQRDVPSNSLVRAYHMGQNDMMRQCFEEIHKLELDSSLELPVLEHISDVIYNYIDWITLFVFDAYESERRRWIGAQGNVHSSTIHTLLADKGENSTAFENQTGYRLDQQHLAVVVWDSAPDAATTLGSIDDIARRTAAFAKSNGPPIITAIDRRTVWAWIPLGSRTSALDTSELSSVLDLDDSTRLAAGLPAYGIQGFRRSHEQARAAYSVATVPGTPTRSIVGFGDKGVAIVSLLAQNLDSTRAWVWERLGPLAEDTPAAAILRTTLNAYFAHDESHLRAAQHLNLHRNTVKYRINKALDQHTVSADKLDLALALQVCEFLGPSVLKPM